MKNHLIILLIFTTKIVLSQSNNEIKLKWKIDKNENLSYSTIMSEIDTSKMEMNFGSLFKMLSDSTSNGLNESKEFLNKLNKAFENQDYITTLSNKGNGIVDIVMTTKPKETTERKLKKNNGNKETELLEMMASLNQGVLLRGAVFETGGIQSFWIKNDQKNLISLFFELPSKSIKIGDKWSIDVNLISNDQNFKCDTSSKINEVMLSDIKIINGETIAVLKYNILEFVEGDFNSPFSENNKVENKTMMKFTHQGIAEFSIEKGRWISYDGIMNLEATGVMTARKKTKFSLKTTK